jgi:hypothetical protein
MIFISSEVRERVFAKCVCIYVNTYVDVHVPMSKRMLYVYVHVLCTRIVRVLCMCVMHMCDVCHRAVRSEEHQQIFMFYFVDTIELRTQRIKMLVIPTAFNSSTKR